MIDSCRAHLEDFVGADEHGELGGAVEDLAASCTDRCSFDEIPRTLSPGRDEHDLGSQGARGAMWRVASRRDFRRGLAGRRKTGMRASSGEVREGVMLGTKQHFVDAFGPPTSTRSAELDGALGEHLRWDEQGRDALIVTRDSTMIALAVESDNPKLFAQMRESFAFVD